MSPRSERDRLGDILKHIEKAKAAENVYSNVEENDPLSDVAYSAILYDIMVIGEAVKALGAEIRERNPTTPWMEIAGMRDVLTHHYYRIKPSVIRDTLDEALDHLRQVCKQEIER